MDPLLSVTCTDDERRHDVADVASTFNGIDWVEVDPADQRILHVGFLHPLPGESGGVPASPDLGPSNVVIEGGERIRNIGVVSVTAATDVLTVTVDRAGDFSPYALRIVRSPADHSAPKSFDPVLSARLFSFKANCPSDLDCEPPALGAPRVSADPIVDYLAKDYDGFRRLMLDRLAQLVPGWTERNPADPLVTVVEALAHTADRMSYRQDAAATEAYLGTARSRISVRRHARLLDYRVHEGCTARTWLHLAVTANSPVETEGLDADKTLVVTGGVEHATVDADQLRDLLAGGAVAFTLLDRIQPLHARNEITIYTWGGVACTLPAGATRATLVNKHPLGLVPGDYLLLEEVRSPQTGRANDADPTVRHIVRLVEVEPSVDPVEGNLKLLEVTWAVADALPFDLVVTSAVPGGGVGNTAVCAVARANLVLAHHAMTAPDVALTVPDLPRWRPVVSEAPIAWAQPFQRDAPAVGLLHQDPRQCMPIIELTGESAVWRPRLDLLASDRFDQGFVVEVETDGRAHLRFGDGVHGMAPAPSTAFTATFSVGGGTVGNVGHDVLTAVATALTGIERVTNPLPAVGGTDAEPVADVRQYAPAAFATQERAVTEADWVSAAMRHPEIQNASARLRWTGSWWTVFLTVDLVGGRRLGEEPALAARLAGELDHFRVAGYDLELRDPVDVPVMLEVTVCLASDVFRSDVVGALSGAFSSRDTAFGRGFFHPDNFSFGEPLYVSQVVAAAMSVAGIRSARVTELHPIGVAPTDELTAGVLRVGLLEVVRLDNDPSIPERGVLRLVTEGGL